MFLTKIPFSGEEEKQMEGSERNCLQYDLVLRFLRIAEPGDAAVQ